MSQMDCFAPSRYRHLTGVGETMVVVHESDQGSGTIVPISQLRLGPSPRDGIDIRHVAALAELDGGWQPLIVQRDSRVVVDGRHRLAAAKKLGHKVVRVSFFEGTDAEACAEAVRLNVLHGLPLSLSERSRAAKQLLSLFPTWSDRHLAEVCALSPRTIARIRSQCPPIPQIGVAGAVVSEKRLGKDGRQYPIAGKAARSEIGRILQEEGPVSLRSVAARTGVSPETVRSVRRSLAAKSDELSPSESLAAPVVNRDDPSRWEVVTPHPVWTEDSACSSTPEGRSFAGWFDGHDVDDGLLSTMPEAVPLSRVYDVIDEARRRVVFWDTFAKTLQDRICRRSARGA